MAPDRIGLVPFRYVIDSTNPWTGGTFGNEPTGYYLPAPAASETADERRLRRSREGNARAVKEAKGRALPAMTERTYYRKNFARRACGERWRVMM